MELGSVQQFLLYIVQLHNEQKINMFTSQLGKNGRPSGLNIGHVIYYYSTSS